MSPPVTMAGTYTLRGRIRDKDGGFTDYQGSIPITLTGPE